MTRASVVIPTFNRGADLEFALPSLVRQDCPPGDFEILVVDNGSTDNTRAVTERFIAQHPEIRIRYLYEPEPGLLSGRHKGAVEAEGEYLIFVDDDIEATPGWLSAILAAFRDPDVHIVGGRNLPKYQVTPPAWLETFWAPTPFGGRSLSYLSLLDLGDAPFEIDPIYVWGLNFAIRRETLFELGGFHPDCIPPQLQHYQGDGESGLSLKASQRNLKALYCPEAMVHHRVPAGRLTFEYFEKRAFYSGVAGSYQAMRRKHFDGVETAPERQTSYTRARRLASDVKQHVSHGLAALLKLDPDATERQRLFLARRRMAKAYKAGFDFHGRAAASSAILLDWVLRPDYWDYKLPELESGFVLPSR